MTWRQWCVKRLPEKEPLDFASMLSRKTLYDVKSGVMISSVDETYNNPQEYTDNFPYQISYDTAGYTMCVYVFIFYVRENTRDGVVVRHYVGTHSYENIKDQNIIESFIYHCGGLVMEKSTKVYPKDVDSKDTSIRMETGSTFRVKHLPGDEEFHNLMFTIDADYRKGSFQTPDTNACLRSLMSKWEGEHFKITCHAFFRATSWRFDFFYERSNSDRQKYRSSAISLIVRIDGSSGPSITFKDEDSDPYYNEFRADIISMCGGIYARLAQKKTSLIRESNMKIAGKIYRQRTVLPLGSPDQDVTEEETIESYRKTSHKKKPAMLETIHDLRNEIDSINVILAEKEDEIARLRGAIAEMSALF